MKTRSVDGFVCNLTSKQLFLTDSKLVRSDWTTSPPALIEPLTPNAHFGAAAEIPIFNAEGGAQYMIGRRPADRLWLNWKNATDDKCTYEATVPPRGYDRMAIGTTEFNSTACYVIYESQPVDWMQQSLKQRNEPLLKFCMPGTHDSGMSTYGRHTLFGWPCNTRTQTNTIINQLRYGARFFDVRPVISDGDFYTGHYTYIDTLNINTWQGANGQSIADVIKDVNEFTSSNAELIVLYISHAYNTDVGNSNYRWFNQEEWTRLFTALSGIEDRYVMIGQPPTNMTQMKLGDFIGKGRAAVVILIEPENADNPVELGPFQNQGFYLTKCWPQYHQYYSDHDPQGMIKYEIDQLKANRPDPSSLYFPLSWTITPDDFDVATCGGNADASSILDMADKVNPFLYPVLLPNCSPRTFPNIIWTDKFETSAIVALAQVINKMASSG